jgi:hypothetical protein
MAQLMAKGSGLPGAKGSRAKVGMGINVLVFAAFLDTP